jgi:ElaB/YqjD/DUF883 family membrane-anchored ribosome-binding protein
MANNDTSRDKADDTQTEAKDKANQAGGAAKKMASDAKAAGRKAGEAASDELSNLKADLDDLISRIPSLSDIDLEEAKEKLMQKFAATRDTAQDMAEDAREQFDHGVECSRDYVKERPLQAVGYAAVAGFLLGLLLARR